MFYIAVAIPKAVPTEFALTTYGTDPQMADAQIEYPIPVRTKGQSSL